MPRLFKSPEKIGYGQRWQVETLMSMRKQTLCCAVAGRRHWCQCRDLLLNNVMIVRARRGFLQSMPVSIL
jgi:hypothetical protein